MSRYGSEYPTQHSKYIFVKFYRENLFLTFAAKKQDFFCKSICLVGYAINLLVTHISLIIFIIP